MREVLIIPNPSPSPSPSPSPDPDCNPNHDPNHNFYLVLGHEGDCGDGKDVVHEEDDARALVDLTRETHRDLLADERREAGLPESLVGVGVLGSGLGLG